MSLTNAAETLLLAHLFENDNWANVGDATGLVGSTVAGSFYIGLHTGDPGEAGNQTTSEAAYTGYARVAVARSSAGWTTSGNNCSNAAIVQFAECTAGSATVTYFSIGTDSSGAGNLIGSGALSASLAVSAGITPDFAIGELDVNAD